jgi:hypothetical protein
MTKKILIATFINKKEKNEFLSYLLEEFEVPHNQVFIFNNLTDEDQFVLTFHIKLEIGERLEIRKFFKSAIIVHKKKTTFYTINALNKLIELEYELDKGNIDYKKYKINWNNYKNKIILTSNNNLVLIDLKRVFS